MKLDLDRYYKLKDEVGVLRQVLNKIKAKIQGYYTDEMMKEIARISDRLGYLEWMLCIEPDRQIGECKHEWGRSNLNINWRCIKCGLTTINKQL
jgi:predicted Zn-ribbon and HTH transcriptional regulator